MNFIKCEPPEPRQHFNLSRDIQQNVAVKLSEKTAARFRLQLAPNDLCICVEEIFEIRGSFAFVGLRVVAVRCLQGRRNLYFIDVARLHFCLHQKITDAVKLPGDNAQYANFRLADNRLLPRRRVISRLAVEAHNAEKFAAAVFQISSVSFEIPVVEFFKRDLFHFVVSFFLQ